MDAKTALAHAPQGSYVLRQRVRVEVRPDITVETMAIRTPHSVLIPFDGVLPDGGFVRGVVELDPRNFERVIAMADRVGGLPVVKGMLQQYVGDQLDLRVTVPR